MVNIEFTSGLSTFKINGISLVRNFHSYVSGTKLRIVNAYDTRYELLSYTLFSDVSVNGIVYGSVADLAEALAPILFLKNGGGGGSEPVVAGSGNIITRVVSVPMDWTQESVQQILNYVNNRAFTVLGTERILFKAVRLIGDISVSNAAEFYFWEFRPGKGNYGVGGTAITVSDLEYTSFVTNFTNSVVELGEIGASPIEVYINSNGPYAINQSSLNVFKALRSGTAANYIYIGNSSLIGLGQTQTVSGDYIDVNAEPVNPPSQTVGLDVPNEEGYIPVSTADGGLYWVLYEPGSGEVEEPGITKHGITYFDNGWIPGTLDFKPVIIGHFMGVAFNLTKAVTAPTADAVNDYIGNIVVDASGTDIAILAGDPGDPATEPTLDLTTQLRAGMFIVKAGATEPEGFSGNLIYTEGAGPGITFFTLGGVSVDQPGGKDGGLCIRGENLEYIAGQIHFIFAAPIPTEQFSSLAIDLKNEKVTTEPNPFRIWVHGKAKNGKNASVVISSFANFGWDANDITNFQSLSFAIASVATNLVEIEYLRFMNYAPTEEANGFFLDNVRWITAGGESVDLGSYATRQWVLQQIEAVGGVTPEAVETAKQEAITAAEAYSDANRADVEVQIDAVEEDVLDHEARLFALESAPSGLTQDDIDEVIVVSTSRALAASDIGKILVVTAAVTLTYPTGGISKFKTNIHCKATGQATIAGDAADLDLPDGQIIEAGNSATFFVHDSKLNGYGAFTE